MDVSQLDCSDEVLDHVVNLLLEEEEKVQQGIDFLIPFKALLTRESKLLLEEKAQHITMPEGFDVLFSILEADYSKKITILSRITGNLAAYYAMYKAISQRGSVSVMLTTALKRTIVCCYILSANSSMSLMALFSERISQYRIKNSPNVAKSIPTVITSISLLEDTIEPSNS